MKRIPTDYTYSPLGLKLFKVLQKTIGECKVSLLLIKLGQKQKAKMYQLTVFKRINRRLFKGVWFFNPLMTKHEVIKYVGKSIKEAVVKLDKEARK